MSAMTKTVTFVGMLVALAISGASTALNPADDASLLAAVDQAWAKAYNSGEVDTLVSLYDELAILQPPGAPRAIGRAAIREFLAKDVAGSQAAGITMNLGSDPTGGATGDLGWSSGTYVVKDKAGQVIDTGKYLSVSVRKDGKWLYLRDTWNSDGAPAAPAPKQ